MRRKGEKGVGTTSPRSYREHEARRHESAWASHSPPVMERATGGSVANTYKEASWNQYHHIPA